MNDWRDLFQPHILERGEDYHEEGQVEKLEKTSSGYRGVVAGSRRYQVEITMKDTEVENMWCSCPYADGGSHCKHMAAVLFAVEEREEEEGENGEEDGGEYKGEDHGGHEKDNAGDKSHNKAQGGKGRAVSLAQELKEAIGRISEHKLRELVLELALCDKGLGNRILTQYAQGVSLRQMARLKKEIKEIAYRNSDRYGFVSWEYSNGYFRDMERFLAEQIDTMIEKNCLMEAFELVNRVFVQVGTQDMDDSDGGSGTMGEICYDYWKAILDNCNEEQKRTMFQWFNKNQNAGIVVDYMEDYIRDFLFEEFQDEDLLRKRLAMVDEELGDPGDEPAPRSLWNRYDGMEGLVLKRFELMEKLGASQDELEAWKNKYWTCPGIRALQYSLRLEEGNLNEAAAILEESKELDGEYSGLMAEHSAKLVDLYQRMGENQKYKDELMFQVFHLRQKGLEFVNMLKAACNPKEWEELKDRILEDEHGYVPRHLFLESEGMYQQLLEEIKVKSSVWEMDHYEKVLGSRFPEQVRDFYAGYVRKKAGSTSTRTHYQELVRYLKKVRKYSGDSKLDVQIAQEWRRDYRRRPALMDELTKGGF